MSGSQKLCRLPPNRLRKMQIVLMSGWLAVGLAGCANLTLPSRVEYIPADRAVMPLSKGQPAPADGWYVPPAVLQEMIPYLDEKYRKAEDLEPAPKPSPQEDKKGATS